MKQSDSIRDRARTLEGLAEAMPYVVLLTFFLWLGGLAFDSALIPSVLFSSSLLVAIGAWVGAKILNLKADRVATDELNRH